MIWPLLISVPHAGLNTPPELQELSLLTPEQIARDGDEEAALIYDLQNRAVEFMIADIARAFIDLNRAENDRRADGVIKTHTCWNEPIYNTPLSETLIETLLEKYYRPYHRALIDRARGSVRLGLDCHTMAPLGPPVGPDPGQDRPIICLSNARGTCPDAWLNTLADCMQQHFPGPVKINDPFTGGHITRTHAAELPWLQIELKRGPNLTPAEKHNLLIQSLNDFCQKMNPTW